MKLKDIGSGGPLVSAIGQGGMGIGGYLDKDLASDKKSVNALRFGIDLGMTFMDTAENYGNGHSEELIGKAICGIREKVFIATKVSPEHLGHDEVICACEGSLKRLATDYIDLYQVHWPNPIIPIKDTNIPKVVTP